MPNFAVLEGESRRESSAKQHSCQTSLRNLPFHLVQCISLHLKSPDLYLFCKTKVSPKFLLPFESQESFWSEELFGSYDYVSRSLSLFACRLASLGAHAHAKKTPVVFGRTSRIKIYWSISKTTDHFYHFEIFSFRPSWSNACFSYPGILYKTRKTYCFPFRPTSGICIYPFMSPGTSPLFFFFFLAGAGVF